MSHGATHAPPPEALATAPPTAPAAELLALLGQLQQEVAAVRQAQEALRQAQEEQRQLLLSLLHLQTPPLQQPVPQTSPPQPPPQQLPQPQQQPQQQQQQPPLVQLQPPAAYSDSQNELVQLLASQQSTLPASSAIHDFSILRVHGANGFILRRFNAAKGIDDEFNVPDAAAVINKHNGDGRKRMATILSDKYNSCLVERRGKAGTPGRRSSAASKCARLRRLRRLHCALLAASPHVRSSSPPRPHVRALPTARSLAPPPPPPPTHTCPPNRAQGGD